jgi:hypothetical protein
MVNMTSVSNEEVRKVIIELISVARQDDDSDKAVAKARLLIDSLSYNMTQKG